MDLGEARSGVFETLRASLNGESQDLKARRFGGAEGKIGWVRAERQTARRERAQGRE